MCQVDEDYHQQLEREDVPSVSKKCVKCKEAPAAVVARGGDAHCRICFKGNFIHKFRAMLGKTRLIFPGEKVLLAVSGGPSSCSMLQQVQEGLSQDTHRKLRFIPGIVYIDEAGAVGQSMETRKRTVHELQSIFRATGFPFHIVPLERVLDLPSSVVLASSSVAGQPPGAYKAAVGRFIQAASEASMEKEEEASAPDVAESQTVLLQQLMSSAQTLTAKEDLLNKFRQHLLVHTARTEGYSKLMLGDSCTRLAVKLLSSISLGRGAQLAQDTGFSDSRYGDVMWVRPMREYSAKEIAFYNHMFSVPSVVIPGLETQTPDKASIQRLTESFVTRLQADFPSTVSTIYRTSEKLQTACSNASAAADCSRCLLCMCTLDTSAETASALQATLISDQLSHNPTPASGSAVLGPEQGSAKADPAAGGCSSSSGGGHCGGTDCCSSAQKVSSLKKLLCYSCQLTVRDMTSVDHLPRYILAAALSMQRRSLMREQISPFLLEDADDEEEEE